MKIFGIGLSSTGTLSLHKALGILGYSSVHFPTSIGEIESNDAAMDTTVSMGYAFLDAMYPDSKFILTVRDPIRWFESMNRRFGELAHPDQSAASKVGHWLFHGVPPKLENEHRLCWIFNEHNTRAESYFSHQPHRFLVMNICAGDGWSSLCSFLDKPVPDEPFPHEHKS